MNHRGAEAEAFDHLTAENRQLQAIAGPLLVEQLLNRILAEQSQVQAA